MSGETNHLVRNVLNNISPLSHLLLDSGSDENVLVYRWDPADFHFDYLIGLPHLQESCCYTSPFWLWGSLGLASMQLPVFSWIGFDLHLMKIYLSLYYHCRIAEILPQWQVCIVWRITNKTGHCYSISVFVYYLYPLVYNKGSWFNQK